MNYVNYEKAIVLVYGVDLVGSTHDVMENPGNIKTGAALNALLSALSQGVCYWRILTADEWAARRHAYEVLELAGQVLKRKQRCDVGLARTGTGKTSAQAQPRKKQKTYTSTEMVHDDADADIDDQNIDNEDVEKENVDEDGKEQGDEGVQEREEREELVEID